MKKKVLIIGPIPPPAGGVSIHITRLADLLSSWYSVELADESKVSKQGIYNIRNSKFTRYFKTISSSDIVHIHSGPRSLKYAHILFSKLLRKKTLLTIHSYREKASFPFSLLDKWMYSMPNTTIIVNKDFDKRLGLKNHVVVKDAFLPPSVEKEAPVPAEITGWLHTKKQDGYTVAVGNAWRLDMHNGEDLYGLDLCLAAAKKLKENNEKVCFVFVVCDLHGSIDITKYETQIKEQQLEDVFYLHKAQISFINLIKETDIVLRPTNTDGDALTVREALFLGKNVIASDVVKRPEGTLLFETRNVEALTDAIRKAKDINKPVANSAGQNNLTDFYKDIYSNLN